MIYKNYTCILPNFLSVEEVSYIHGYAQQIDTMNSRVGGGAATKDQDSLEESGGENHSIRQSTNKWIDHNDLNFDQKIKQKIFDGMVQANPNIRKSKHKPVKLHEPNAEQKIAKLLRFFTTV